MDNKQPYGKSQQHQEEISALVEAKVKERTAKLLKANEALQKEIALHKHLEQELTLKNRITNIFLTTSSDEEMYAEVLKVFLEVMQSKYGVFGYIDENEAFVVPSINIFIFIRNLIAT